MSIVVAETKQEIVAQGAVVIYAAAQYYYNPVPALFDHSGNRVADLPLVSPGDRFEPVSFTLQGQPFTGKLKHFSGAATRPSPEVVTSDGHWGGNPGQEQGFLLDFGGLRSVLRLISLDTSMRFTLVLPWQGTDFAGQSLYPPKASNTPAMKPDDTGSTQVSLRGTETQKLYVQVHKTSSVSIDQFLDQCVIETAVAPSQVRASVADRPPFWTHPGPLQGEVQMTGLAEALSAWAADLPAPTVPKLFLQTDTPGVLDLPANFSALKAEKSAQALWAGNPDTAIAVQAGVPCAVKMLFPEPAGGPDWELRSLKLNSSASLSPWILETLAPGGDSAAAGLKISARFNVARGFTAAQALELHGLSLLMASEGDAELNLEIQPDENGKPASAEPAASIVIALNGPASWKEARLEQPLGIEAGARFWVVLKIKSGEAQWMAGAETDALSTLFSEEGTAWQDYPRMLPGASPGSEARFPAAAMGLLRLPFAEENQARIVLSHANGSAIVEMELPAGDETAEVEWLWPMASRPVLAPGGSGRELELELRTLSSGTLNVDSAAVFYSLKS